jgi:hypothetical protein
MPACPTSGNSHASRGSGVHTTQQGKQCGGWIAIAMESLSMDDPIFSQRLPRGLLWSKFLVTVETQEQPICSRLVRSSTRSYSARLTFKAPWMTGTMLF